METYWLTCHPDTPQSALTGIRVWAERKGRNWLSLEFRALGDISAIRWPAGNSATSENWSRQDVLWQHTCFEFFLRSDAKPDYVEVNLATSNCWAAYQFDEYRAGMRQCPECALKRAYWRIQERRAQMKAVVQLPNDFAGEAWHLALSAVIEEVDGTKSYWALAHPPGKPDFHHPACFAASLPAPLNP